MAKTPANQSFNLGKIEKKFPKIFKHYFRIFFPRPNSARKISSSKQLQNYFKIFSQIFKISRAAKLGPISKRPEGARCKNKFERIELWPPCSGGSSQLFQRLQNKPFEVCEIFLKQNARPISGQK